MRNDKNQNSTNAPRESEDNYRIRTVTSSLGRDEGDKSSFEPSRMRSYEVSDWFGTDILTGLDEYAVKAARKKHGTNELFPYMKLSFASSLKRQISGLMGPLLALMCLVVDIFDPNPIYICFAAFAVMLSCINAITEQRTAASLEEVQQNTALRATVLREGKTRIADSRALVPGDIIHLERGSIVPADARLLESNKLTAIETPLTGSAEPVFKSAIFINKGKESAISRNMVYGGTIIASGNGTAIVTATGANLRVRVGEPRGKDRRPRLLNYVGTTSRAVMLCSIAFCFVCIFAGALCGADIVDMFMLSLAIGYITLTDTVGTLCTAVLVGSMSSMLDDGAAIRNADCIQSLCEVDTIMCDSANTFPVRGMRVESAFTGFHRYNVTRENTNNIGRLLVYSLACSDVKLEYIEHKAMKKKRPRYIGSKSDIAVARACREMGIALDAVREMFFTVEGNYDKDSGSARVLVINQGNSYIIEKGDPAQIIRKCEDYEQSGTTFPLVESAVNRFLDEAGDMADKSQNVFAIAFKKVTCDTLDAVETQSGMTFIGLLGLYTSIEMNAASAVYQCNNAGITPVVRSVAPYATAVSLAKDAGIIQSEDQAITGEDIVSTEYGLFVANNPNYRLFLNVTREQWEQVENIRAANGAKIAFEALSLDDLEQMTTAKVSFVPSDAGSDTLRQCADVVLFRDGFNVMTSVLCKAKLIYRRIHSALQYSLIAGVSYAFALLAGTVSGIGAPFGLEHIMLCGGIINLAVLISLVYAPMRSKTLADKLPYYGVSPSIRDFIAPILYGVGGGVVMLVNYIIGFGSGGKSLGMTMAYVAMTVVLIMYSFVNLRRENVLGDGAGKNALIFASVVCSTALLTLTVYVPSLAQAFGLTALAWRPLVLALMLPIALFLVLQTVRALMRVLRQRTVDKRRERLFGTKEQDDEADGEYEEDE